MSRNPASQVNTPEIGEQDALTEAQLAQQAWIDVLQSVQDRDITTTHPDTYIVHDATERTAWFWRNDFPSETSKTDASKSSPTNELTENPFKSPFDSPFDDPISSSSHSEEEVDDDAEFGEFEVAAPPKPSPRPHDPFKDPVYAANEDGEADLLLPGEDATEHMILEGEGLVQPLESKFDLATRRVRRNGIRALRIKNMAKEKAERKAQEALKEAIKHLPYHQQREVENAWDQYKEDNLTDAQKRDRKEFQRIQEGANAGIVRPVRSAMPETQNPERHLEALEIWIEDKAVAMARLERWEGMDF